MQRGIAVRALRVARWLTLAFAVALVPGQARADNDYYDNVQGGAAAKSAAPRLALQNSDVELVAVAQGRQLVIYLDRFDDGTPIDNAEIEVTAGDEKLHAAPVKSGVYVVSTDWAATPGQYKLTFAATIEQASATLAGTLVVTPPRGDTGDAAKDDNNDDSGSSSSSSSPLTISLPVDVALSLGFGVLAALGLSALVVFRRPAAVAVAGTQSRSRLAAWPGRWVAVMLATGFVLSLLLVGGGVLARKDGMRQAMGGVVGLLH